MLKSEHMLQMNLRKSEEVHFLAEAEMVDASARQISSSDWCAPQS